MGLEYVCGLFAEGADVAAEALPARVLTLATLGKHQTFHLAVRNAHGFCGKASSAEFAPDPALDPLWISYWEPFHGAAKKDFGFQVTLKVATA